MPDAEIKHRLDLYVSLDRAARQKRYAACLYLPARSFDAAARRYVSRWRLAGCFFAPTRKIAEQRAKFLAAKEARRAGKQRAKLNRLLAAHGAPEQGGQE